MGGEEGGAVDEDSAPETVDRGHKMDEGLRWFSDFFFGPILWFFGKLGISPNLLTVLGMALALASGYYLAVKRVPLAAVLFVLSGVFDIVDGYVAKKIGEVTVFGSFLDSFSDRVSDAAIYVGLMVYYLKLSEGIYVGLAVVLLVASFLISYLRARAEALGVECRAGLMARAPRFLAVGFGLFFNGLSPWILKVVMWIVAALLVETFVERLIFVWRELEA
ncbi:MAG: CDP-alcohol phosphatidyltransferase family protein [Actinobacteria bacterium]|nr:CDP-alcohol phosphatidyltransferase family protein [Actinomycetota bacterium]